MKLTQSGKLPIGIVVDGVRHQDFEMRPPTVDDHIAVAEEIGPSHFLLLQAGVFARQLVRLGTLDPSKFTLELVRSLNPVDWTVLEEAAVELQKKLQLDGQSMADGSASHGGPSAVLPSPATA